jgi:DNA-binding response OmpR family regulator
MEFTMRILMVEDDKKVASFLGKGLRENGYSVGVAHEGTEGSLQAALVHGSGSSDQSHRPG